MKKIMFCISLMLCWNFGLIALERGVGDGENNEAHACEMKECPDTTFGKRSLSASPRSFFDLEVLAALSQQLHSSAIDCARIATPSSIPTPHECAAPDHFMAVPQERPLSSLQRRKIRAAIADITVPGMSPVFDYSESSGKRSERGESDQDMTDVIRDAPLAKIRPSVDDHRSPDYESAVEEPTDRQ